MPEVIVMPKFGWTMSEATITAWLKHVGDAVEEGEPLFSIETEKVNYEVEARESGVLLRIVAEAGRVVPVGEVVGYLGTAQEAAAQGVAAPVPGTTEPEPALVATTAEPEPASVAATAEPEPAVDASGTSPLERRVIPLVGTRRTIAERMRSSLRESAQLTLTTEVDATRLVETQARFNAVSEVGYNDLLLVVVARALKTQPQLNSTLEGGAIHLHEQVHIGLAVDTPAGLLVPVLREVDRKDAATIGAESRALAERARAGRLTADELSGGTFTLTSLGAFGIDAFTPIVNPPQTAILGVGRVAQKPVVRDGRVEPGATLVLSLSFDHQVVDGAPAARFLQEIARAVEAGEFA